MLNVCRDGTQEGAMEQDRLKTYYDSLGITADATAEEIEEAYRQTCALYGDVSVAVYSLHSKEERKEMLAKAEEAYNVLLDVEKRGYYDSSSKAPLKEESLFPSDRDAQPVDSRAQQEGQVVSNVFDINSVLCKARLQTPLVVMEDSDPMATEQYRLLYTKIEQISMEKSYKTFAITSAVKGEGKSVTSLNLAYVIARDFGKRVLLIECDFRNPAITAQIVPDDEAKGLVNVIRDDIALERAVRRLEDSNLDILSANEKSDSASELLSSTRFDSALRKLKNKYDYIFIDSPPMLPLADINMLTKFVDGLLLVVRAGKTPRDMVVKAVHSLSGGEIVGIILNGVAPSSKKYYY